LTSGPKVRETPHDATAYGHRDANWVLHYKHQWVPDDVAMMETMMQHHREVATAIDRHLPCRNFYNYIDNDMPCAATNEAWLQAHFSDVPRMHAIKERADPLGLFRSRLTSVGGDDPSQPRFEQLSQGSCTGVGLRPITDLATCEAAAKALKLSDTIAKVTQEVARPEGCYFYRNQLLYMGLNPLSAGQGAETSTPGHARLPICSSAGPEDGAERPADQVAPSSRRRRRRRNSKMSLAALMREAVQ